MRCDRHDRETSGVAIPAVTANSTTLVSLSLAGVRIGDQVGVAFSNIPDGMIAGARVTAIDTVRVTIFNAGSTQSEAFTASIMLRAERLSVEVTAQPLAWPGCHRGPDFPM